MLWFYAPALFMVVLNPTYCFPREKSTEKPEIPLMGNPKHSRPTHISEFTDPDTGRNPFLDLEEGRTSMGRNVMEDERRDDQPYLDPVEGDAPDRKQIFEEPSEHLGRVPPAARWPEHDYKEEIDLPVLTMTPSIPANPPTTVEIFITKDMKDVKLNVVEDVPEIQHKVKKDQESFVVSPSTVIYATATLAVMTVIILLVGACWWRKKLKTSRSSNTVESGETKS